MNADNLRTLGSLTEELMNTKSISLLSIGRTIIIILLIVLLGASMVTSYFDRQQHEKLVAMLTDPDARPKAWSSDMDDARTQKMCAALKILALYHTDHKLDKILAVLPQVCITSDADDQ